MAEELLKRMSEAPAFVQNVKQSEEMPPILAPVTGEQTVAPPSEELKYVAPLEPPDMLDYLREPAQWAKSGMGGLASGISGVVKTANLIPGTDAFLDPIITDLDARAKWWEPKEAAPGRVSNWVRSAATSIGQSTSAGLTGAAIALAAGPGIAATGAVGVAAATIGAILSKGATFGGAQYYDLTKQIEEEFKARGANAEEIAIIQKENAAWKAISGLSEVGGEYGSDFISARIFGLTGNPAIREFIKKGIMAAFGRFAKKMGWVQLSEGLGEQFTTAVQYKAAEKIDLHQDDYLKQVVDTFAVTGIQTLVMGAAASAVASTRGRSTEAFQKDLKLKTSAALVSKGVDKDTADTIADTIIKRATKTDAADGAIAELEGRETVKKATKAEREVAKAEKKVAAAERTKEIIKTILAPEPTEEFAGETLPAIKLKDGTIIKGEPGQQHFAIADARGIPYENVVETAFISKTGEYEKPKVAKPTIEERPTAREEKLAKLKGEKPIYRTTPTPETAARVVSETALPKQEVTFTKLAPSETAEVPDVIVQDQSGQPAIFNPDIHVMDETNMKSARRDLEVWTPTTAPVVETTRERRLRILREAGRIPGQPIVAPETVEKAVSAAEVVAVVKKMKPGLIEHIDTMSKKGWSIDDFINDPDVKADLEGIVPENKYYDLILDIKEEIGAMTSTDIFDKQIRDEQRALDSDFAAIDKMKDEDRMQRELAERDEYYDPEQQKWVQLEKDEIVSNIETQFVEPPSTVESVSVVVQVTPEVKKVFSRKVVDNTVWYQPKEEAMTQLDLLKQTKLDWNSDIDAILHALTTQVNVAYHTRGEVLFSALSRLTNNLDYFKKNLSHDEYNRLINSLDSLRKFMVDVSDAIKATDEPVKAAAPKAELQNELLRIGDMGDTAAAAYVKGLDDAALKEILVANSLHWKGRSRSEAELVHYALRAAMNIQHREGQPAPKREKYDIDVRYGVAQDLFAMLYSETYEPKNAATLIDFLLSKKDTFSAAETALAEHFNTPAIRQILKRVKVNISLNDNLPIVYYAGVGTAQFEKSGGAAIDFRHDYVYQVSTHDSSVGEDILHEVTHALTSELMRTSGPLRASVRNLRLKAIDNLGPNDRQILFSLNGSALAFHAKSFKEMGFARGWEYGEVYYGLLNEGEFLSTVFSSPVMQQYLSAIPYETTKTNGKIKTLWDKFKEVLSLSIFNKPMGERESTLLDAALNIGNKIIEINSQRSYTALAYEGQQRSVNASVPRMKSIDVEQALQSTPLKGSGIHAGAGTPIQQNVTVIQKPIDVTRLSTYINSPLFALRDHPDAMAYAEEAIDALGVWGYSRSLGFSEIDRITKELSEAERIKVTSLLKEIESGEVIDLNKLNPKIKTAIVDTRKLLDLYKEKHKKFMRESLILGTNSTEARIFADVLIGGESVIDATKKWNRYARAQNRTNVQDKVATTTYAEVLGLFKEWKEIENFGIKDYVTHAMRGSIALSDPEGHIISFAQTQKKAVADALQYLKENPTVESIEVDTTYRLDKDFQTLVSQKYYRAMKGKIAKLINQYSKEISKDLSDKLKAEIPGKGIAIKPMKIWSQFLQEREEELPGEKDVFDILPLYVHSLEKKHALDPYIMKLRDHLHEFSDRPNVKKVLEDQLTAIRGQYSVGDAIVDDLLGKLGFEQSFSYTRGLAATRVVLTNLKLGFRPVAALVNLLSGMGHTWVKTSAKYMIEAHRVLATEGGKEFIKKNAPSLGTSIVEGFGGDLENRLNWYSPLKLFQAPEIPNRETSFMASYLFGRGEFGYDETTAVEFAKRSVDMQQFNYTVAAIPEVLRGPTGKTIGQFKTYLVKEIEFIRGLKGANQWAKYLTMQAVLGGPRGMMITLKSLPFLMLIGGDGWLDDLDTWLNNNYPKLSRGVFGFFGIDASGPASFQFPEKVEDWAGVLISDIVKFGKEVAKPFSNSESYLWEDVKKYSKDVVPVWRLWSEFWQGLMNDEGWILDEHGNNKFKVESWTDLAKMVGGFKPLKMSVQELEMRMSKVLEDREKAQANKIVEQIVKRHRMIDVDIVTEELVQEVAIHALSADSIISAIERSHLDPATRQLLGAKMQRRMELWQRQLPVREFRGY